MRRKIALTLYVVMVLSVILAPIKTERVYAASNAKQIINAIGIMDTDKGSNENGSAIVTRGRFSQMLVNISSLKDTVSSDINVSLFSDVKKSYWAAGYIQTAVNQGWMSGYLNGKFKPTQGISLQEAVYAVVQILGYSSSDFSGNLTSGIMKLYKTKELNENISKTQKQYLTVNDCYNLFYNMLTATTKTGTVYAVSLGYTLDSYGEIDYLSLVSAGIEGPVIVDDNWKSDIPFSVAQATFYQDGVKCSQSDISDYDVLYYSESTKTIWVYDNKITGTIESINPDYSAPVSVTVADTTYTFADSDVAYKFSSLGDVKEGDIVTLLLGKENTVVDVLDVDEYNTTVTGVVLETGTHLVQDSSGNYVNTDYVTFVDASGNEYQEDYDADTIYLAEGKLVRMTFTDSDATISSFTLGSATFDNNTFSSDGSTLGNTKLASNVKILDLNGTNYVSTYPERLANVLLGNYSIYYYELNDKGEISQLILNNITGDTDQYGVVTSLGYQGSQIVYSYMIDSTSGKLVTSSISSLCMFTGPMGFVFEDGTLTSSYKLSGVSVSSIGTTTVLAGGVKYPLADDYQVYLLMNDEYTATTVDKISDLSKYSLKAYYDSLPSEGGEIRVIVAESIG